MIKVKPQATRQIEQELTKEERAREWGVWTTLHSRAAGLVITVTTSCGDVFGRRSTDTSQCQPRRTT